MPYNPKFMQPYKDFRTKIQLFQIIIPPKLIYTKVTFVFWESESILPFSKVRSCTGRVPTLMQQLTSEGLEKAQGELGKTPGISPGSLKSLAIISQMRAVFSAVLQHSTTQFH